MSKYTFNYPKIYLGKVMVNADDTCETEIYEQVGLPRGKTAYFDTGSIDDPSKYISSVAKHYAFSAVNLFISPKCSLPRDVIRNSGYKIKLDPENAQYTVVEEPPVPYRLVCNIVAQQIQSHILFLFEVQRQYSSGEETWSPEMVNKIYHSINAACGYYGDGDPVVAYYKDNLKKATVYFLPKCQEWEDIYLATYSNRRYVLDSWLSIKPLAEINLENLIVWSKCEDNIVESAIVNSNWREYPATLCFWLVNENILPYSSTISFEKIRAKIGYYDYKREKTLPNYVVSKKDWTMLQSWILHKCGIEEKGQFVDIDKWNDLPKEYKKFLRAKVAVAPVQITADMTFENFVDTMENSSR